MAQAESVLLGLTGLGLLMAVAMYALALARTGEKQEARGKRQETRNDLHLAPCVLHPPWLGQAGTWNSVAALMALTAALVVRGLRAWHWPFATAYEFALCFVWGTVAVYLLLERWCRTRAAGAFVISMALLLLGYACFVMPAAERLARPLLPSLRSIWFQLHVIPAAVAYAGFAVAGGAGATALLARRWSLLEERLPSREAELLATRAVAFSYPWMTAAMIFGAIWAQFAWGRYWSWDIKEVWALIVWLVYTLYLHARALRGWRGRPLAWLAVVGLLTVLFTFLGAGWLARTVGLESLHVF